MAETAASPSSPSPSSPMNPAAAAPHGSPQEGTEAHGGNFPPFNSESFPSQLSWLVFSFILLYVLMARMGLPKIARALEERRDKIADDLDTAAKLKEEADAALKAYEDALSDARSRAQAIAKETADKLRAESERLKADVDAKLAREMEAAEARITTVKNAALGNLRTVASDVTGAVVNHLLGAPPPADAVEQAVDAVMSGR